jgi:hypothetical protein
MRYLWLCLLIIGFLPTHAQEPSQSDAPYLYYYSDIVNGFVIERADGTDSRVLGAGLVDSQANGVYGAGWSPSGEWFAFTSFQRIPYGGGNSLNAVVIHVSGERLLNTLQNIPNIAYMQWLPNEDVLLLESDAPYNYGYVPDANYEYAHTVTHYYWVDATTDLLLRHQKITSFSDFYPVTRWLKDGEYYFVVFGEVNDTGVHYFYKIFDYAGKLILGKGLPADFVDVSSQGWVVYADTKNITFSNVWTKVNFSLTIPKEVQTSSIHSYFSPNGQYALLKITSIGR